MKRKRKPYTFSDKCKARTDKRTDWSKRAAIYSLRFDDKMKVIEIAKLYKITRERVYQILRDCQTNIDPLQ